MTYLNRINVESKELNLYNRMNNKVSSTKTFLYCNNCGKSIYENLILCYIFIDYFCSEKCHDQKHELNLKKINDVN